MDKLISVIIPAHNEEKSIQNVVKLLKINKLVNEIIVVDNASTDKTGEVALREGANVIICPNKGKGHAMEVGIQNAKHGIILFLDGDIVNYSDDIVRCMTEDLINDQADFIKAKFERDGGRVTELLAKPLLDILFPDIPKFEQPLGGFIAGKKEFFEKLELEKDYGVDIGILLDMIKNNARIKEVYIGSILNDSKDWKLLEKMSREVAKAIIKRVRM